MSCEIKTSDDVVEAANKVASAFQFITKFYGPTKQLSYKFLSPLSIATQGGVVSIQYENGTGNVNLANIGGQDVSINAATASFFGKIAGTAVLAFKLAGYTVPFLSLPVLLGVGLTGIGFAVAARSNKELNDVLTDPDFYGSIKDGTLEKYLKDTYGLDTRDFLDKLFESVLTGNVNKVEDCTNKEFNKGTNWTRPRDPLVLDLDGDGIELTAASNTVLFDHNKDNIKTGTQWVKPDDGILVRDLNGNGLIDSGRELFGDQTELPPGFGSTNLGTGGTGSGTGTLGTGLGGPQLATNGWQALSAIDSNRDGVIDASDAAFAELKVWRDLNQDGISQADELQTLTQAGVSSITLAIDSQATSSYTTSTGATRTAQNINFTTNNFYSEFTDNPVVTSSAAGLPQLQGAGFVRDMREAMSLGTAQAGDLLNKVSEFKAATTTQQRQALVNQVINAWSATSAPVSHPQSGNLPGEEIYVSNFQHFETYFGASLDARGDDWRGLFNQTYQTPNDYGLKEMLLRAGLIKGSNSLGFGNTGQSFLAVWRKSAADVFFESEFGRKIAVLERFNGTSAVERYTSVISSTNYQPRVYGVGIPGPAQVFFDAAYKSLQESVYQNLYLQTEGKTYLDLIELVLDNNGLRLDFTKVNSAFAQKIAANAGQAATDLAEFISFTEDSLASSGWDGAAQLGELLETAILTPAQTTALQALKFQVGVLAGSQLNGAGDNDILVGKAGNDVLVGNAGADVLIGGQGNDYLVGGQGNDQLVGGAGDDKLEGQWGNDTYFWGRGQGNDTIIDTLADANGQNTVVLRGLNPQDITVSLLSEDDYRAVRLTIVSTGETLDLRNSGYSWWYGNETAPVNFVFDDGTRWDMTDAILRSAPVATTADDVLVGTYFNDLPERLAGGEGNDLIIGREGADVMEGGAGNDTLWGNGFKVTTDTNGNPIAPTYRFKTSYQDSDTYIFGIGDGQDTINDTDYGVNLDTLRFKAGVSPTDLSVAQRGDDLLIQIRGTTDQVTVKGFFLTNNYWWQSTESRPHAIEKFVFEDGTTWDLRKITDASWLGTDQDDTFFGDAQANVMAGGNGKDTLYGGLGNDGLSGGAGDDVLDGGDGDDILDGGQGNDVLSAGKGRDTVRFGRGDGQDTLVGDIDWYSYYSRYYSGASVQAGGNNVVELKAGVTAEDIKLERINSNLVIRIKDSGDSLTINGFADIFNIQTPAAEQFNLLEIRFADGTVWSPEQILAYSLIGDALAERFEGFAGDETFDGQGGNDATRDYGGNNTYLFGRGDGNDEVSTSGTSLLSFKSGVAAQDVQVRRVGEAAVFTIKDTGDSIVFNSAFIERRASDGIDQFAGVRFADGSQWSLAQINQLATRSTDSDDEISDVLEQSQTTLNGGTGNDVLSGTRGETTYLFNRGDGQDTVIESYYGGTDTMRFGNGITASDLVVTYRDQDLVIGLAGTADQITVKGNRGAFLENFEVGGVSFTYSQIVGLIESEGTETLLGSADDDILTGTAKTSNISGFGGNDVLTGNANNDVIDGGEGNDILSGGTGRDILEGGTGSNVYRYQPGDQLDTINLTSLASTTIELGAGISQADMSVQLNFGYNPRVGYTTINQIVIGFGNNDALVINAPLDGSLDANFADTLSINLFGGTTLNLPDLLAMQDAGVVGQQNLYYQGQIALGSQADDRIFGNVSGLNINGRDNNDLIVVEGAKNIVNGGAGDDVISVFDGDAVIAGGRGNDEIEAYGAKATYVFNRGDGKDRITGYSSPDSTLSFGVGITAGDVRAWIDGANGELVLSVGSGQTDEIRSAWFNTDLQTASDQRMLKTIQFIDASGVAFQYDLATVLAVPGGDANELVGHSAASGNLVFQNAFALSGALPRPVSGGLAAIAYAQTSDLNGAAVIAANADVNAGNQIFGTVNSDSLNGEGGNDVVLGDDGNDLIWGGIGDDYLDGQSGNDRIDGGNGDDVLYGGSGDDVLTGGKGNNAAYGERGNDEYVFSREDGRLYIEDSPEDSEGAGVSGVFSSSSGGYGGYGGYGGSSGGYGASSGGYGGYGGYGGSPAVNQLTFRGGITASDLSFSRSGDNLVITVAGATGDVITLAGFDENRATGTRSVDKYVFQNGETLNLANVVITNGASAESGVITGTRLNDELRGGLQNDVLQGGRGNDRLIGGAGADAYLMGDDDGVDTIIDSASESNVVVFSGNLSPNNLQLSIQNGLSTLTFGNSSIVLAGWNGLIAAESPIKNFVFSDGSTLTIDQLFNSPRTIRGTPQDDVLTGTTIDDVIEGLGSNDLLLGGAGADTYIISSGSGKDTITDLSTLGQENTILFTDITNSDNLVLSLNEQGNMLVRLPDGGSVTLTNFDRLAPLSGHSVEFFQFGVGGPTLTYAELLGRGFVIDGTETGDLLRVTALFDQVTAGAGDDVIEASTGSDALAGGAGSDTYNYRLGDGLVTIEDVVDPAGGNILRFGPGITVESIERKLRFVEDATDPADASLNRFLIVFDENNQISVSGFDRQNPNTSQHGIESFEFADGTVLTWNELLDKIFVVEGDTLDNTLEGTSRSDRLYGYHGADTLRTGAGDDVLTGGLGNDVLEGGAGLDNYVFNLGDGQDQLRDTSLGNTLTFGAGVDVGSVIVTRADNGFKVSYGTLGDSVFINSINGITEPKGVIKNIELSDGTSLEFADLINRAPTAGSAFSNQASRVGDAVNFALDAAAFADADGDELRWFAQLGTDQPLPSWLQFDIATRTFSGIPPVNSQGAYQIAVYASDASGVTVSQSFTLNVVPRNFAPAANIDAAAAREDVRIVATGNVLDNDTDIDMGDQLSVTTTGTFTGNFGTLLLAGNGTYTYTLDSNAPDVQKLKANEQVVDSFAYTAFDGQLTSSSQLVVTVTGTNDVPVAFADVSAVNEDVTLTATGNVLGNDKDVDIGDALQVSAASVGTFQGTYGSLSLTGDGSYTYTLNNGAASVQALGRSAVVTDTFSYTAQDTGDTPLQATSALTVTITGTNDDPQAVLDLAAVTEDATTSVTGNVLNNDKDGDVGDTLAVVAPGFLVGAYGNLILSANGSYSYMLNNAATNVQNLQSGQQVTDTFAYSTTDGLAVSSSSLVITVTGTNDMPTVDADTAGVSEDGTTFATGDVLLNDADVDGDLLTISNAGVMQGTYGQLTLQANGTYEYQLNNSSNAVQSLRQDQRVTDVFALSTTDNNATATSSLTVTVNGRNDMSVAQDDAASVQEDTIFQATGNVLSNDSDVDIDDVLTITNAATYAGQYGSLQLHADGSYVYTLDNDTAVVQSLALGQPVTESFVYTVSDGRATSMPSAQANLVITISGSNDAPVLELPVADISVRAKTVLTLDLPDNMFTDIDRNDLLGYTLTLSNGQAVPSWLTFNPNGLIISGTPPKDSSGQSIELRLTALDRFGASTSDVFTIGVTSCVGLTLVGSSGNDRLVGTVCDDSLDGRQGADTMIGGEGDDIYYVDQTYVAGKGNEGLGNGQDAPPPGHDTNQNDGAGTSPGNPGSRGGNSSGAGNNSNAISASSYDVVTEYLNQGYDKVFASASYTLTPHVEALELTERNDLAGTGNSLNNWIVGNSGANTLDGKEGNDLLSAGDGNDIVYGGAGNDVIEGQAGNDTLDGGDGIDALFGGLGNDKLRSGAGSGFLAGGKGNDSLYAANAATIVAFNKGDGVDTLYTSGPQKITLSLGGGLKYEDVKISRTGNDLFLTFNASATDRIKVADYYKTQIAQRPTFEVQMLTEASSSYLPTGSDVLSDHKIERFNGTQLIADFDRAYQATANLRGGNQWAVMGSLLRAHLGGSNSMAMGGDLAYQYGQTAGIAGLGALAATNALSDTNFASATQVLQSNTMVSVGSPRLAG